MSAQRVRLQGPRFRENGPIHPGNKTTPIVYSILHSSQNVSLACKTKILNYLLKKIPSYLFCIAFNLYKKYQFVFGKKQCSFEVLALRKTIFLKLCSFLLSIFATGVVMLAYILEFFNAAYSFNSKHALTEEGMQSIQVLAIFKSFVRFLSKFESSLSRFELNSNLTSKKY